MTNQLQFICNSPQGVFSLMVPVEEAPIFLRNQQKELIGLGSSVTVDVSEKLITCEEVDNFILVLQFLKSHLSNQPNLLGISWYSDLFKVPFHTRLQLKVPDIFSFADQVFKPYLVSLLLVPKDQTATLVFDKVEYICDFLDDYIAYLSNL